MSAVSSSGSGSSVASGAWISPSRQNRHGRTVNGGAAIGWALIGLTVVGLAVVGGEIARHR